MNKNINVNRLNTRRRKSSEIKKERANTSKDGKEYPEILIGLGKNQKVSKIEVIGKRYYKLVRIGWRVA